MIKLNKILYTLIIALTVFTLACDTSDSDNIVIVGQGNQKEEEEENNEDQQELDFNVFDDYSCYDANSNQTLDIASWNIQYFPQSNSTTINLVKSLIENSELDIIALQEINDPAALSTLKNQLSGWDYVYVDVRGDLELAYFYKTNEISSISNLKTIFEGQNSPFPRAPIVVDIEHTNGQQVTLINIHLKCCGGSDNVSRRAEASNLLEGYIEDYLDQEKVVLLGDFNDDIHEEGNPFTNFINKPAKYYFADMEIANGAQSNWSYPDWPSHIDHVLITNELYDYLTKVTTLTFDECIGYNQYDRNVSDHRPVMISLEGLN